VPKALAGIESVRGNAAGAVLVDGTAPVAKPAATKVVRKAFTRKAPARQAAAR
jgi:hypothetical protein